jgi:hypothetical protein
MIDFTKNANTNIMDLTSDANSDIIDLTTDDNTDIVDLTTDNDTDIVDLTTNADTDINMTTGYGLIVNPNTSLADSSNPVSVLPLVSHLASRTFH